MCRAREPRARRVCRVGAARSRARRPTTSFRAVDGLSEISLTDKARKTWLLSTGSLATCVVGLRSSDVGILYPLRPLPLSFRVPFLPLSSAN